MSSEDRLYALIIGGVFAMWIVGIICSTIAEVAG